MHLLIAIHMQGEDFYLSQINELIDYYGIDAVKEAENNLYKSRLFSVFCEN